MDERMLPAAFSMALAQNPYAMKNFAAMTQAQQTVVVEQSRRAKTKREMQYLVARLADWKADADAPHTE